MHQTAIRLTAISVLLVLSALGYTRTTIDQRTACWQTTTMPGRSCAQGRQTAPRHPLSRHTETTPVQAGPGRSRSDPSQSYGRWR